MNYMLKPTFPDECPPVMKTMEAVRKIINKQTNINTKQT